MNIKDYIVLAVMLAAITIWSPSASALDIIGIYAGVSTGKAEIVDSSPKEDDTATKVYAGYRMFGPLSIEVAQIDFGDYSNGQAAIGGTGANLVLTLPLPFVDIFAKAGVLNWNIDYTSGLPSEDGTDPAYGFGVDFSIFPLIGLRLEYEKFQDIGSPPANDMDLMSIGLNISF